MLTGTVVTDSYHIGLHAINGRGADREFVVELLSLLDFLSTKLNIYQRIHIDCFPLADAEHELDEHTRETLHPSTMILSLEPLGTFAKGQVNYDAWKTEMFITIVAEVLEAVRRTQALDLFQAWQQEAK